VEDWDLIALFQLLFVLHVAFHLWPSALPLPHVAVI